MPLGWKRPPRELLETGPNCDLRSAGGFGGGRYGVRASESEERVFHRRRPEVGPRLAADRGQEPWASHELPGTTSSVQMRTMRMPPGEASRVSHHSLDS